MIKIDIIEDDPLECFIIEDEKGVFEISEEDFAEYQRVMAEYDLWQEKMKKMYLEDERKRRGE